VKMSKYGEKKVTEKFYRMTFSVGEVTEKEIADIRKIMQKLEKIDGVMRCFQNIDRATNRSLDQQLWQAEMEGSDFTIYYRENCEAALNKLLFKLKLKYPDFSLCKEETLQSYI